MYNSKELCFDEELTFLSYKQPINAEFTVSDILNGGLWSVSSVNDSVYRCVPLFNCDTISSSNSKDIVLEENKCLIVNVDDDTVITVSSEDTASIHYYTVELYAFTPYTKLDVIDEVGVYCIVSDEYLNKLNNVPVNVVIDGTITSQIQSNNQGICKYTVSEPCEISFEYNENTSNTITINGGE